MIGPSGAAIAKGQPGMLVACRFSKVCLVDLVGLGGDEAYLFESPLTLK
jgi:hypothetical protein